VAIIRTRSEALEYLGRLTDYEKQARFGQGYRRPDLGPIRDLLGRVGNPQEDLRSIHIAGTKGKGSTALMLERLLLGHGLSVGLYTSPHLMSVTERIRVDGRNIEEADFASALDRLRPLLDETRSGPDENAPTFFDVLTAMAFCHFAEKRVDVAILETGMGGRLDSTNVVKPVVTVITNVDLDHTETLGPDIPSIALEKAGILKEGVPLVTGVPGSSEAWPVVRDKASELRVPVLALGREVSVVSEEGSVAFEISTPSLRYPSLVMPVLGRVQRENAGLAVMAAEVFLRRTGFSSLGEDEVARTFSSLELPGRCELFPGRPDVLLDSAHNEASARVLARVIEAELGWSGEVVLLFSMNKRPRIDEVLAPLLPLVREVVMTRVPSPRSEDPDALAEVVRAAGIPVRVEPEIGRALELARARAGEEGKIVATGSFWSAGVFRHSLLESDAVGASGS